MSTASRLLPITVLMLAAGAALPAHADLAVSGEGTRNVSCQGQRCTATAADAVMNVRQLRHLLASGKRVVMEAGPAKNIAVNAPLSWTSSAMLELKARHALTFNRPVTVAGAGGVTIQTEDGGLSFAPKASLTFWNLSSKLTINGLAYTLVGDIKSMKGQVSSPVALARDYDASLDGFNGPPISSIHAPNGHLDGLGHTISNFRLEGSSDATGLVGYSSGTLANLHITHASISDASGDGVGVAVGWNSDYTNRVPGLIDHVSVEGTIYESSGCYVGGLAGYNAGMIRNSSAKINIPMAGCFSTGGLVGNNASSSTSIGVISNSWATGTVRSAGYTLPDEGGLAGFNCGVIENSYTLANTRFRAKPWGKYDHAHGGLIGETGHNASWCSSQVVASYAAGATAPVAAYLNGTNVHGFAGGVVGFDGAGSTFKSTYWVADSSRHTPKQAAGNRQDEPGMTGLTEAQLKSALPAGFDPKIWAQSPDINNGFPYLLNNPPQ